MPGIRYLCPDALVKSSGIRSLYQQVWVLARNGFDAAILHKNPGFRHPDMPDVPIRYGEIIPGQVVVIPEVLPNYMRALKDAPVRRVGIALNWKCLYEKLDDYHDWRYFKVERVLVTSSFIGDFVSWAMKIPVVKFTAGINGELYFPERRQKLPQVCWIKRKGVHVEELQRVLHSRNPDLVRRITWKPLDNLSETNYASEVRRASVFLNLSSAEGFPTSVLEAMRARTLVAGYNSVGAQRELVGTGQHQNSILSETFDYVTLARKLEPVLGSVLRGDLSVWEPVLENAYRTSLPYTLEEQERTVLAAWRNIMSEPAPQASLEPVGQKRSVAFPEFPAPSPGWWRDWMPPIGLRAASRVRSHLRFRLSSK